VYISESDNFASSDTANSAFFTALGEFTSIGMIENPSSALQYFDNKQKQHIVNSK
jgi:hypothetical protein